MSYRLSIIGLQISVPCIMFIIHTIAEDPRCTTCGDPVVRTYDGAYLMVFDVTKYLLTKWDDEERTPCKFQVRCTTSLTYFGDK